MVLVLYSMLLEILRNGLGPGHSQFHPRGAPVLPVDSRAPPARSPYLGAAQMIGSLRTCPTWRVSPARAARSRTRRTPREADTARLREQGFDVIAVVVTSTLSSVGLTDLTRPWRLARCSLATPEAGVICGVLGASAGAWSRWAHPTNRLAASGTTAINSSVFILSPVRRPGFPGRQRGYKTRARGPRKPWSCSDASRRHARARSRGVAHLPGLPRPPSGSGQAASFSGSTAARSLIRLWHFPRRWSRSRSGSVGRMPRPWQKAAHTNARQNIPAFGPIQRRVTADRSTSPGDAPRAKDEARISPRPRVSPQRWGPRPWPRVFLSSGPAGTKSVTACGGQLLQPLLGGGRAGVAHLERLGPPQAEEGLPPLPRREQNSHTPPGSLSLVQQKRSTIEAAGEGPEPKPNHQGSNTLPW